jgi:hypothetical protein
MVLAHNNFEAGFGMTSAKDDYSEVVAAQLNLLAAGSDYDLYDAILDAIELVLSFPTKAQTLSTAIVTREGARLRLPVTGHSPYKVFWSSEGPRIEAVFPHPSAD